DGFVPTLLGGQYAVYTGVVELDPLSDAVGARTQYHYFFLIRYDRLVVGVILRGIECRIVVGGTSFKLRRAGIHAFVHTLDTHFFPTGIYFTFLHTQQMGNLA